MVNVLVTLSSFKASSGGGGRGMRVVRDESELIESIQLTKTEARVTFNNDMVYMEKFLGKPTSC